MGLSLSRDFTQVIHFILDQCIPPVLRDCSFFMRPLLKLLFGKDYIVFADFKERVLSLDDEILSKEYASINALCIKRETDLNRACMEAIESEIIGKTVLEVGAGRCYLARRLSGTYQVTAADVCFPSEFKELGSVPFKMVTACVDKLPFPSRAFDTVICAHTLEHVIDIAGALEELRRVAAHRLILVVPRQRPYKYTFDTHIHFFPYPFSFLNVVRPKGKYKCQVLSGDIFYQEDVE